MIFTADRAPLLRALKSIKTVVERRNTVPILSHVLIRATPSSLTMLATDMDQQLSISAPAEIEVEGCTAVDAHALFAIVNRLPAGVRIALSLRDNSLHLDAGRAKFTLPALPHEDFPIIPFPPPTHEFELVAKDLRGLIDRTRFAISTEQTRYYLNGLFLHATKSGDVEVLRAAATDGHRLARVEVPLPEGAAGMPGVIVPRRTVQELRKLLDKIDQTIAIELSDTKIRFDMGQSVLTSKLIDGTFPKYDAVIPTSFSHFVTADVGLLKQALHRVAVFSSRHGTGVCCDIDCGVMTLKCNSLEFGSSSEQIEVGHKGVPIIVGLNSRYLGDIINNLTGFVVEFQICDAHSPIVARDPANDDALYVQMTMRV